MNFNLPKAESVLLFLLIANYNITRDTFFYMGLDLPLFLTTVYIYLAMNAWGWGFARDKRYIVALGFIAIIYLISNLLISFKKNSLLLKFKVALILTVIAIVVFGISANLMYLRNKESVVNYINDSGLQAEIAGRFLLLKKNPYVETYENTDLAKWNYVDEASGKKNPALYINVIPPFMISASALGYRVFSQFVGWFDIRIIMLIMYFSVLIMGFIKFGLKESFLLFLILVGLNPLFISNIIQGSNDVVVLAFLLWSLLFLEKKKILLSGIFLGLAVATKQPAWLALPMFLFYVFKNCKRKDFLKFIASFLLISLAFYLPFALWNFDALLNNLVFYASGAGLNIPIHPLEGYGFSALLVPLGIVESIYSKYSFANYQFISALLFITLFIIIYRKKVTISSLIYGYTILVWIVWFFSRYFLEAHIAFLLVLLATSYLWSSSNTNKIS